MLFDNTMTPDNSNCETNKNRTPDMTYHATRERSQSPTEAVNSFLQKRPKAYHERMTCPLTLLPGKRTETDRNILI